MAKKFLYFQPEYVGKFKCDGSKCNAFCCVKKWNIIIDDAIYKKYSRIKPKDKAEEILSHIKHDDTKNHYLIKENPCPFLTENNLCELQLNYGEKFLCVTCATYPRITNKFGTFFERSLTITCPVAAEMILFNPEPMQFEFVEVSAKVHSNHGKISVTHKMEISTSVAELMIEIQVAMISILQERTLTIDQRLIVLCFFVDKLEEIYLRGMNEEELRKLIAIYESKEFLAKQVPNMLKSVEFDAEKFIRLMMELFESFYSVERIKLQNYSRIFLNPVVITLKAIPDENGQVSISEITTNYRNLAEAQKKFFEEHSTFLENFLVNEFFKELYPWIYHRRPTRSLSVFLVTYKVFELIMFSMAQNNLSDKNALLKLVDWYTDQSDHSHFLNDKIFVYLEEQKDFFVLMESLLAP